MKVKTRTLGETCERPFNFITGEPMMIFDPANPSARFRQEAFDGFETIRYADNGPLVNNECYASARTFANWPKALTAIEKWQVSSSAPYTYQTSGLGSLGFAPTSRDSIEATFPEQQVSDAEFSAALRARNACKMPRTMNLPLATVELKDTKRSLETVGRICKFLYDLPLTRRKVLLAASAAEVCGAYLTWIYGVKPTKRDIEKFRKEYFGKGAIGLKLIPVKLRKGQRVRAPFELSTDTNYVNGAFTERLYSSSQVQRVLYRGQWLSTATVCGDTSASAWPGLGPYWCWKVKGIIYGEVEESRDVVLDPKKILRYNGGLWTTTYELIPFSFLLDQFLDIGGYIQKLEKSLMTRAEGEIVFKDGLWLSEERELIYRVPIPRVTVGARIIEWKPDDPHLAVMFDVARSVVGTADVETHKEYQRRRYSTMLPNLPILAPPSKAYQLTADCALVVSLLPIVKWARGKP